LPCPGRSNHRRLEPRPPSYSARPHLWLPPSDESVDRSAESGSAHTRTSAPSARDRTASPTTGSTSPRPPCIDNNTRTSCPTSAGWLASADDSAPRPGSCRKPPNALYGKSGKERSPCLCCPLELTSFYGGSVRAAGGPPSSLIRQCTQFGTSARIAADERVMLLLGGSMGQWTTGLRRTCPPGQSVTTEASFGLLSSTLSVGQRSRAYASPVRGSAWFRRAPPVSVPGSPHRPAVRRCCWFWSPRTDANGEPWKRGYAWTEDAAEVERVHRLLPCRLERVRRRAVRAVTRQAAQSPGLVGRPSR
jgi:hypothetical protein